MVSFVRKGLGDRHGVRCRGPFLVFACGGLCIKMLLKHQDSLELQEWRLSTRVQVHAVRVWASDSEERDQKGTLRTRAKRLGPGIRDLRNESW